MSDEKSAVEKLAMDFRRWGKEKVKLVQAMTERYGLPMEGRKVKYDCYSNGSSG